MAISPFAFSSGEFRWHALKLHILELKLHILEIERKNHVIFAPGLALKMDFLNRLSGQAAKNFPYREHLRISHQDVQAAIHSGVITESYPAARGYTKVTMYGADALGSCKLTVYLNVPGPGSVAPLVVEDFIVVND